MLQISNLQEKLRKIGQAGYRRHVSITAGHVERPLREAFQRYLKYDLTEW